MAAFASFILSFNCYCWTSITISFRPKKQTMQMSASELWLARLVSTFFIKKSIWLKNSCEERKANKSSLNRNLTPICSVRYRILPFVIQVVSWWQKKYQSRKTEMKVAIVSIHTLIYTFYLESMGKVGNNKICNGQPYQSVNQRPSF